MRIYSNFAKHIIYNSIKLLKPLSSLSFSLEVKQSSVPNAGKGVYAANGLINKFSVVCLYPGVYYPPPPAFSLFSFDNEFSCLKPNDLLAMMNQQQNPAENAYVMHCNNSGGSIDAENINPADDGDQIRVGHLINHPPKGIKPNVFPFDFIWEENLKNFKDLTSLDLNQESVTKYDEKWLIEVENEATRELNPIGEGIWFIDPSTLEIKYLSPYCASHAGVAIVASRDILAGEELFIDYRYEMSKNFIPPDWYYPVDL